MLKLGMTLLIQKLVSWAWEGAAILCTLRTLHPQRYIVYSAADYVSPIWYNGELTIDRSSIQLIHPCALTTMIIEADRIGSVKYFAAMKRKQNGGTHQKV